MGDLETYSDYRFVLVSKDSISSEGKPDSPSSEM